MGKDLCKGCSLFNSLLFIWVITVTYHMEGYLPRVGWALEPGNSRYPVRGWSHSEKLLGVAAQH